MKYTKFPRRRHSGRGEMISSATFIIVGLFFAGEASVLWDAGQTHKASLIGLCALLCIGGGLRFQIHNLCHWLKELQK